jgi:DnaJ family protein C protein 19
MKIIFWLAVFAVVLWLFRKAAPTKSGLSVAEAARILEITPTASADDIQAAHRRLIARVHPDAGGSAELASRVNEARDILLRRLSA